MKRTNPQPARLSLAIWVALCLLPLGLLPSCPGEKAGGICPCTGCCLPSGTCLAGNSATACGLDGVLCATCRQGDTCEDGRCVPIADCNGCVVEHDCLPGNDNRSCGRDGDPCQACSEGYVCVAGKCDLAPCYCPQGCCLDIGCQEGKARTACGRGGQPCVDCSERGESCNPLAGECTDCSECTSGCCQGGECLPGNSDSACGIDGANCLNCAATQQKCNPRSGRCRGCPDCATGCCDGSDCLKGDEDAACGIEGVPCDDCTLAGMRCDRQRQRCIPLCVKDDGSPCETGCCLGPYCVEGTADAACGWGGELCEDCAAESMRCRPIAQSCGPGCPNCQLAGCCLYQKCEAGDKDWACGKQGRPCRNCQEIGDDWVCSKIMGRCEETLFEPYD